MQVREEVSLHILNLAPGLTPGLDYKPRMGGLPSLLQGPGLGEQ